MSPILRCWRSSTSRRGTRRKAWRSIAALPPKSLTISGCTKRSRGLQKKGRESVKLRRRDTLSSQAKRPEKPDAHPMPKTLPTHALPISSESAGAGRSLAIEGAGDVTDSEMLAELYIAQGHPEKGLEVYRRLVAKDPDNVRLHENIIALEEEGAGASRRAPAKASPETTDVGRASMR